jgi:DNA-binding transcriptional LysR family regulator
MDAEVGQSLIDFALQHPDMALEIMAEDRFVDLIEENFDLAIRITKLEDSGMIARKLSDFRVYACATPAYVAKHAPLEHPQDLVGKPVIIDTNTRTHNNIRFQMPEGGLFSVSVSGPIEVNSPQATLRAARAGLGVAMVPDFIALPYIQTGELVTLFDTYIPTDRGIYAVYPHRRYLPAKVRSFVDYLSNWFRKAH